MAQRCRSRGWTVTDYVVESTPKKKLEDAGMFDKVKYLIYGYEICPTTGRPHYQTAVFFFEKVEFGKMRKIFNNNHCEAANGSEFDNKKYCGKDGKFEEFGEPPSPGKRKDLDKIKDEIMAGKKVDDICVESPMMYHQYGRTLNKIEDIRMRKVFRTEMTACTWYHGPTGVGKSHKAFENYSPETHYVLNVQDNGWWDGYVQQETVIINEFRGQIPFGELLDLIDKYPKTVKRRNRESLPFISKHIIITSALHPSEIYKNLAEEDMLDQLYSRIKIIKLSGVDRRRHEKDDNGPEVVGGNTSPLPGPRRDSLRQPPKITYK